MASAGTCFRNYRFSFLSPKYIWIRGLARRAAVGETRHRRAQPVYQSSRDGPRKGLAHEPSSDFEYCDEAARSWMGRRWMQVERGWQQEGRNWEQSWLVRGWGDDALFTQISPYYLTHFSGYCWNFWHFILGRFLRFSQVHHFLRIRSLPQSDCKFPTHETVQNLMNFRLILFFFPPICHQGISRGVPEMHFLSVHVFVYPNLINRR